MPIINMVYKKKKGWKPGANTIAYYPLKGNLNDYSGHNYNGTLAVGTLTYPSNEYAQLTNVVARFPNGYGTSTTDEITISMRLKDVSSIGGATHIFVFGLDGYNSGGWGVQLLYNNGNYSAYAVTGGASKNTSAYSISSGVWHNMVVTIVPSGKLSLYIDGTLKNQVNVTSPIRASGYSGIGTNNYTNNAPTISGCLSNIINENKARTADEVLNYYNQTKANYQSSSGGGGSGGSIPAEPL